MDIKYKKVKIQPFVHEQSWHCRQNAQYLLSENAVINIGLGCFIQVIGVVDEICGVFLEF